MFTDSHRPNRFAPTHSLRRLKTAFSPARSMRSLSPSSLSSISSTSTCSPLTRTSSPDGVSVAPRSVLPSSSYSFGRDVSPSNSQRSASGSVSGNSIREALLLRRKPSVLDVEIEEERRVFGTEMRVLEPRPMGLEMGMGGVGIFEVLDGKF